jgi:shikimate kinase
MEYRIILVGFMASGKTTLGKKIAKRLSIPFIDSDAKIEELESCSIQSIFEKSGEVAFRELESNFLTTYDFPSSFVLSTGGGMPCFNSNIDVLNSLGTTFYLQRPVKELVNRLLQAKEKRPLVEDKSVEELEEFIANTLDSRSSYYLQSKFVLNRESQTPEEIIDLLGQLNEQK